jgi:hypothetical protein
MHTHACRVAWGCGRTSGCVGEAREKRKSKHQRDVLHISTERNAPKRLAPRGRSAWARACCERMKATVRRRRVPMPAAALTMDCAPSAPTTSRAWISCPELSCNTGHEDRLLLLLVLLDPAAAPRPPEGADEVAKEVENSMDFACTGKTTSSPGDACDDDPCGDEDEAEAMSSMRLKSRLCNKSFSTM